MSSTMLTPLTLYKDLDNSLAFNESIIKEYKFDGIKYTDVYFSGRETKDGRVQIFARFAVQDDDKKHPAILIIPDVHEGTDLALLTYFAKNGYAVLLADIAGENQKDEIFTKYPECIGYANIKKSGTHFFQIHDTAKDTCWYEWTCVAKYALNYFSQHENVDAEKIGALGIKSGANVMWQLIANEPRIKCAIPLFGAGWAAYAGIYKFADPNGIEMTDERCKWIAGVDAHAYAPFALCPVFFMTATNNAAYDADRASDTVARVNKDFEANLNYSMTYDDFLGADALKNIDLFFEKHLIKCDKSAIGSIKMKILAENGGLWFKVTCENAQNIRVFYSEGCINPALRNWHKAKPVGDNLFKGEIFSKKTQLFAIAKAVLQSGYNISTPILHCSTADLESVIPFQNDIVFDNMNEKFNYAIEKPPNLLFNLFLANNLEAVRVEKGPFGIRGITSEYAIKFYTAKESPYRLDADTILKFDAFSEYPAELNLVAVKNINGVRTEYFCKSHLQGGNFWQNFSITANNFKSLTGMQFLTFENTDILIFKNTEKIMLNNILFT